MAFYWKDINFLHNNHNHPFLKTDYLKGFYLIIEAGSYKITQISHTCLGLKFSQ